MSKECNLIVFSNRAYNAIIRETLAWDPVETGGILLGHILSNGIWVVMEMLPPGYSEGQEGNNVYHEMGYFEYNQKFVNYLANSVATQYEKPLTLLGLWHRHPGSMDHFSSTDDVTNKRFALQNQLGTISGLINIDPKLRLTMFYVSHEDSQLHGRPNYERIPVEIGDDIIPEDFFCLRFVNSQGINIPQQQAEKRNVEESTEEKGVEPPIELTITPSVEGKERDQKEVSDAPIASKPSFDSWKEKTLDEASTGSNSGRSLVGIILRLFRL